MAFFLQMNKVIYVTLRILPWWWNGRHAGLKILWEQSRAGSSPARGTNLRAQFIDNQCLALFLFWLSFTQSKRRKQR